MAGQERVKYKILADAKDRGGLGLPDFKLYFAACCLVWMKEWILLRNKRKLELEGHNLRFGWHSFLWYDKVNVAFKNNYVRSAILWNKYKPRLCPKIPLLTSGQEAFYSTADKEK